MKRFLALIMLFAFLSSAALAEYSSVLMYESRCGDALCFTNDFGDEVVLRAQSASTVPVFRTGKSYRVVMTDDGACVSAIEIQPETAIGLFIDQAMHSVAFMGPMGELLSFYRQTSPGVMSFEGELISKKPYRLTYLGERLLCIEEAEVKTFTGVLADISVDFVEIDANGVCCRFEKLWDEDIDGDFSLLTPGSAVTVTYAGDRLLSVSSETPVN